MNVLFITDRYPPDPGGAANSAERISRILLSGKNTIHIINLTLTLNPGEIISEIDETGRIIHKIGMFSDFDTSMQWLEIIINGLHKKVNFHVMHGHGIFPAGFLAAFCAKINNIKSIVSIRGNDLDRGIYRSDTFQHILWTLENASAVSAVSTEAVKKSTVLSNRNSGIVFTPNGVDVNLFKPARKSNKILSDLNIKDEKVFLFTGELRFKKGQQFILDAYKKISEKMPVKFIFAGEVRDKTEIENFLLKYPSLRNSIILLPYIVSPEKLIDIYNICDFFLSPSLWDGMPNSVLEAMACEKVVIGTTVGGIPDLITHGVNGILLSPDDLPRLSDACIEAANLPESLIRKIKKNARKSIINNFTSVHEISLWQALYESL